MNPFTTKGARQPKVDAMGIIINGAIADPVLAPICKDDAALDVSAAGNQRDMAPELFGIAPDSPIPKKIEPIST